MYLTSFQKSENTQRFVEIKKVNCKLTIYDIVRQRVSGFAITVGCSRKTYLNIGFTITKCISGAVEDPASVLAGWNEPSWDKGQGTEGTATQPGPRSIFPYNTRTATP